jgi:hypothetical protein
MDKMSVVLTTISLSVAASGRNDKQATRQQQQRRKKDFSWAIDFHLRMAYLFFAAARCRGCCCLLAANFASSCDHPILEVVSIARVSKKTLERDCCKRSFRLLLLTWVGQAHHLL